MRQALLLLLAWLAGTAQADEALQKVLDCMRANVPPTLRIQDVELTTTDRAGGVRVLKGRLFALRENGLLRSMLRIGAPPELAGASYLVRETEGDRGDEMYMYLPAVNRVRRIAGASADSALLGTDFSYSEVKQIENAFSGGEGRLEKPAEVEHHAVHVLNFRPAAGQTTQYTRLRVYVDQKTCVALRVEFYEGETLRKLLSAPAASLQQSNSYWYFSQAQMKDLKQGTSTQLQVVGVTSGSELPNRYFLPHSFYMSN